MGFYTDPPKHWFGRSRVCCVYKEGVALPADLSGLLYKKVFDNVDEIAHGLIYFEENKHVYLDR